MSLSTDVLGSNPAALPSPRRQQKTILWPRWLQDRIAMARLEVPYQHSRSRPSLNYLKPIVKAYALAYLTSTIPKLPATARLVLRSGLPIGRKLDLLKSVLSSAIGINRLPTSCAVIVGGSTILPHVVRDALLWLCQYLSSRALRRLLYLLHQRSTLICSFLSAWLAFGLLNTDKSWARKRADSQATQAQMQAAWESPNQHRRPPQMLYAGKTIDFTLFAACRAIDVLVITAWIRSRGARLHPERLVPQLSHLAKRMADPSVFATSSAIIMWSWFYAPERLPKTYNHWISNIAQLDPRLFEALRLCRKGDLVYGSEYSADAGLPSLCKELNLPEPWGTPALTVPIPCELYHCGAGRSCEIHAGTRFLKTFRMAMRLYLPLQLVSLLRKPSITTRRLISLLKDAARSSSFLAAFVSFFYYAVCLARTRLGPKLFSRSTVSPQMWDSGLCVLAGCLACGWSILLEKASRRQEIAFFVAPRALATLLPRVYDKKHQVREQIAFASSVAIVMTAVQSTDHHVRGVFGKILEQVLG